jgi:hypothetical protein
VIINLKKHIKWKKKEMIDVLHFCAAQCSHCYDACNLEKIDMSSCMMNDQDCAELWLNRIQLLERT